MISNKISNIPSFASQAQLLVPMMHHRLSGDSNKKITISKSLFGAKSLIIPIEEAGANCITLEDFLAMLDARINSEYVYRGEITQLKENICNEFNKLCDEATDEDFIKFVRDQRQRIIDALVDETNIEGKMIADKFYNDMMSGLEEKALGFDKFDEFVYNILWKPLLTPLPVGVVVKLKELMEKLENDKPNAKIEEIASVLVEYIKTNMKSQEIRDSDFESSEELRVSLEKLRQERKVCNIIVSDILKSESIVEEFQRICVEKTKIEMNSYIFLDKDITINYEELYLEEKIEGNRYEKLKIQRNLKSLSAQFGSGSIEDYQQMIKNLSNLKSLSALSLCFERSYIREEGAKAVSAALRELKNISILTLDLTMNDIGEEGAKAASAALRELKNISTLILNLEDNNIGKEGAKAVSAALRELKNITTLDLNFRCSRIEDEGAKAVSAALRELKNMTTLTLNLVGNSIEQDGIKAVSAALIELKNISALTLNLGNINFGEDEVKALSAALKKLKNLSTLILYLQGINIGDEGTKAVSGALGELKNISTLTLDFYDNNIRQEGAKAVSTALGNLKNISNLYLGLGINIGQEGVKEVSAALKELKNISTLSLEFGYNNIKDEGAKAVSGALKELKNISNLYLGLEANDIGDEGAKAVSAALTELKNISTLTLFIKCNLFGDEGAKAVSAALMELKNISKLKLLIKNNFIGEEGESAYRKLKLIYPNSYIDSQV